MFHRITVVKYRLDKNDKMTGVTEEKIVQV